jgi:hypothetical protein
MYTHKNVFRTVRELLDSSDCVTQGDAVMLDGSLYADSVANLQALRALEPALLELLNIALEAGMDEHHCCRTVCYVLGFTRLSEDE